MKREIIKTADGSSTIYLPEWNEHYHSKHGAIQEAQHVFIKMGLLHLIEQEPSEPVSILEIGFGTGLNAFITALEAEKRNISVSYTGIEAYPVAEGEVAALNYSAAFEVKNANKIFKALHKAPWGGTEQVLPEFNLQKKQGFFHDIIDRDLYDLIYFDAFGPRVQPDLWTEEIFIKMFTALRRDGMLVTYSAKGSVRRAMEAVGFDVERLPGPPGKREMLRAVKKA